MIRIFAAKFSSNTPIAGRRRRAQGFTLIELMITIVIASILLAIGVPSMRNMIHQNRLSGSVNEFIAATMLARSEAIKRGSPVTLCRSVNAESGSSACSGAAGDWNTGWLVKVGSDDTILARQGALPAGTTVSSELGSITYNGMGQPTESGNFTFDNDCKLSRRLVEIARSGRASVTTVDPAGC